MVGEICGTRPTGTWHGTCPVPAAANPAVPLPCLPGRGHSRSVGLPCRHRPTLKGFRMLPAHLKCMPGLAS